MTSQSVNFVSDAPVLQRVVETIKDIRYGSVEVVIHDGKVVQIERREKLRFESAQNHK